MQPAAAVCLNGAGSVAGLQLDKQYGARRTLRRWIQKRKRWISVSEECQGVLAEQCERCGRVVCSRWDIVVSTHVTEAVRQLPPTGPARSSDEPSHPIELCRAAEAQEAIAAANGSSGSTVATGDAVTFAAIGCA